MAIQIRTFTFPITKTEGLFSFIELTQLLEDGWKIQGSPYMINHQETGLSEGEAQVLLVKD